jgi:hypothetical protein
VDELGYVAGEHGHEEGREQTADQDAVTSEQSQCRAQHDLDPSRGHDHAVGIQGYRSRNLRSEGVARPEQVAEAGEHHRACQRPRAAVRAR